MINTNSLLPQGEGQDEGINKSGNKVDALTLTLSHEMRETIEGRFRRALFL
jgi:hypothetical protein